MPEITTAVTGQQPDKIHSQRRKNTPSEPSWKGRPLRRVAAGLLYFTLAAAGIVGVFWLSSTRAEGDIPVSGILGPEPSALAAAGVPSQSATASPLPPTPSPTRTPFLPKTFTPTPSRTPTAAPTATSTATPEPTEPPEPPAPPEPPESASVGSLTGRPQSLGLSCESRSAVDWAAFFGHSITELEFLYALPTSDNPNVGFVGSPNGLFGSIPPNAYGVHARPVARLLRAYGVNAHDGTGMSYDDLRREIASGEPVIAWVIGGVWSGYSGTEYTASDGETMTVARYEHTVIVVAYDSQSVTVVDNHLRYSVPVSRFIDSWEVLGRMAVIRE